MNSIEVASRKKEDFVTDVQKIIELLSILLKTTFAVGVEKAVNQKRDSGNMRKFSEDDLCLPFPLTTLSVYGVAQDSPFSNKL